MAVVLRPRNLYDINIFNVITESNPNPNPTQNLSVLFCITCILYCDNKGY